MKFSTKSVELVALLGTCSCSLLFKPPTVTAPVAEACISQKHAIPFIHVENASILMGFETLGVLAPLARLGDPRGPSPFFTGAQLSKAYNTNGGITVAGVTYAGQGTTIALIDPFLSPSLSTDVQAFLTDNGLSTLRDQLDCHPTFTQYCYTGLGGSYTNLTPCAGGSALWAEEISLDVEAAMETAPCANVVLVSVPYDDNGTLLDGVDYAGTLPTDVVSMSWGSLEFDGADYYDSNFQAEGTVFVAGSGDEAGVYWPAVSPYVLGIGGTTLTLDENGNYSSEVPWTSSGAGVSQYYSPPAFQGGLGYSGRVVPDFAMTASPGITIVYNGSTTTVSGTSLSGPLFAGHVAIADSYLIHQGAPLIPSSPNIAGNINASPLGAVHDIVRGADAYPAAVGFDEASGIGSVQEPAFAWRASGAVNPFSAAQAVFQREDTTTRGDYTGTYGADGALIAPGTGGLPSYASVEYPGAQTHTWSASTSNPAALNHVAANYDAAKLLNVAVNLTDGETHQVSLYFLDWDGTNSPLTLQVYDPNSGAVIDTREINTTNAQNGVYEVYSVTGSVVFGILANGGSSGNAVFSALFFDTIHGDSGSSGSGSEGDSGGESGSSGNGSSDTSSGSSSGGGSTASSGGSATSSTGSTASPTPGVTSGSGQNGCVSGRWLPSRLRHGRTASTAP